MSNERRLAVLIDSDNVSAKYAPFIMEEVSKYGTPTYKRVYGDWEKGGNGWHYPAINYSIMPMQQSSYIAGKNATDFSMIIDAMDILYTGRVDGFVLVTSDSDFTRLAIRLREAGMLVIGIGELKTPRAFTISCHHFSYLNQVCEPEGMSDEKTIRKAVIDYVTESNDERMNLAKIFAVLTSRFGNINFDEMGYKRFSNFIDSFPELTRRNTFVSLKKQRREEVPVPKPSGAPTEQEIIDAIGEYFREHGAESDNMMKLESYLNGKFGKIDFSRFGSKRFARFIDRSDEFKRDGTNIFPSSERPQLADNKLTVVTEGHEKADMETISRIVLDYAMDNMPDGGNMGQLNNELIAKFGKNYCADAGFADFKSLLEAIRDIKVRRNHVYLTDTKYAEFVESLKNVKAAEKKPQSVQPLKTQGTDNAAQEVKHQPVISEKKPVADAKQTDSEKQNAAETRQTNGFSGHFDTEKHSAGTEKVSTANSNAEKHDESGIKQQGGDKGHSNAEKENSAGVKKAGMEKSAANHSDTDKAKQPDNAGKSAAPDSKKGESGRRDKAPDISESHSASDVKPTNDKAADEKKQQGEDSASKKEAAEKHENTDNPDGADTEKTGGSAKAEINAVKRDILQFAATTENGTSAALGNTLSRKYGKNYLKELGYRSMKKLLEDMKGISIDGNGLKITEEFAQRTEEIEKFVNDFARGEGSHSIRALGIQLKNKFEGFNFTDYGFGRFTDFINAIDGVHADRYHIKPTDSKDAKYS